MFGKEDVPFGLGVVFRPRGHRSFDDGVRYFHHPSQIPFGCSGTHPDLVPYRFGSCVPPYGSDSFSHVVELQPLRRFILHSPCRTHPSGRVRRIPNVSALSQGLHTFILLRTHALVGSMGNESHGYFTFPFFTFLLIAFMSHP